MSAFRRLAQGIVNVAWRATHPSAPVRRRVRARFDAGRVGRLVASWSDPSTSLDADLFRDLETMRTRSRELWANNEHARAFGLSVQRNVAGPRGFNLQNRARFGTGRLDLRANDAIEAAWRAWRRAGQCDVTRQLSGSALERLVAETVARDGEVLVRIVRGYGNRAGYALQVLEADHLDHEYDLQVFPATGNRIRMGVEQDRWGAPVAYHLRTEHPGDYTYRSAKGTQMERVPVADIRHLFMPLRPHQSRGVPWLHAAMVTLHHLGDYRQAAVFAAKYGAAKMGFYITPDGLPPGGAPPGEGGEGQDYSGATLREVEPGQIETLPEGVTWQTHDPTYPHEQFDAFNTATLRGFAAALGVAHHNLSGDLSGVNFSSARIGELSERDMWRAVQDWMIGAFMEPIFEDWLRWMLTMGKLPLPADQFDRLHAPAFQARAWEWVDPLKEGQAHKLLVDEGFTTLSRVIRARGEDPEEIWRERAAELELRRELGLTEMSTDSEPAEDVTDEDEDDALPAARSAA